jgi:hypothetical protein
LSNLPNSKVEILHCAVDGETAWTEWHWWGTRTDRSPLEMRGVTIMGVRAEHIAWARLYMEPVTDLGGNITSGVKRMTAEE